MVRNLYSVHRVYFIWFPAYTARLSYLILKLEISQKVETQISKYYIASRLRSSGMRYHVLQCMVTNIMEETVASIFRISFTLKLEEAGSSESSTGLHSIASQKTTVSVFTAVRTANLLVHGFMLWNVKNNLKHKYWSLYFHPSHISSDLVFTVTLHSPHICNSLPPFRLWMSWHFTNSGHWTQYSQSISQRSILRLSSHLVSLPSGLPTKILHALHVCSFRLHV